MVGAGSRAGDGAMLLPHVVIYPGAHRRTTILRARARRGSRGLRLGDDVVLQNGAVVGGDGFGFAKGDDGQLAEDSPIGPGEHRRRRRESRPTPASTARAWARRGSASGAKIDNLVQVGHGSSVGENTLLCAQVGLAGSTRGGQAT